MSPSDPLDRPTKRDSATSRPPTNETAALSDSVQQDTSESINEGTVELPPSTPRPAAKPNSDPTHQKVGPRASTIIDPSKSSLHSSHFLPDAVGKFKIKGELGRGAFGVVYLGYDEELEREVAIKISLISDPERQKRLKVEAARAAQVESLGIVPVYHIGNTDDGAVYFVQKYIKGCTLRDVLRQGPLSPVDAVALVYSLATSLVPAHQQDILHRDLKPDNILIDKSGQPWIADFGLAISENDQSTSKRELAGTPPYMSPEQIRGRIDFLDPRSDIWALGVIFYESLTGRLPFRGESRKLLTDQICEKDPKPMQQYAEALLTDEINAVFLKACAKKPSDRFATTNDFAKALQQLLGSNLSKQNIRGEQRDSLLFGNRTVREVIANSMSASVDHRVSATAQTGQFVDQSMASLRGQGQDDLSGRTNAGISLFAKIAAAMAVIGLSVIGSVGYQMYRSVASPDPDLSVSAEQQPGVAPPISNSPTADRHSTGSVSPEPAIPLSQPPSVPAIKKLPQGTQDDPMVVAADGTGSHRTIVEALADVPVEGYISLRPGVYQESLIIEKPVTIIGPAPLDGQIRAELTSDRRTVIESASPQGNVKIQRVLINGRGSKMTNEFNAIEVLEGTLLLSDCDIRTISFNGAKVRNQSNFGAVGCRFFESSQSAISSKDDSNVKLIRCDFQGKGIESVGGKVLARECNFFGDRGVVANSKHVNVQVQDCVFTDNRAHGVIAHQGATVSISDSTFENCKNAIWVDGGKLRATGDCVITGATLGVQVNTGEVLLEDMLIESSQASAVAVAGPAKIKLVRCEINGAGQIGIDQAYGELTIEGGRVSRCQVAALSLSPPKTGFQANDPSSLFFRGKLDGCLIVSGNIAILASHGSLDLKNVTVQGSGQYGIVCNVAKNAESVTIYGRSPLTFANDIRTWIVAKGRVNLHFDDVLVERFDAEKKVRLFPPAAFIDAQADKSNEL